VIIYTEIESTNISRLQRHHLSCALCRCYLEHPMPSRTAGGQHASRWWKESLLLSITLVMIIRTVR